jgi:hypothetical protein
MKTYPSIERKPRYGAGYSYVFDKLDGSNIRAEWARKGGFTKFGRRNGLLDDSNPVLKEAIGLFQSKYAEDLSRIFRDQRWMKAIAFLEFWGPGSFAGNHADEPHNLTLFDVAADKKGILEPREFIKVFDSVDHAALLYQGNFNHEIEEQVRTSALEGMTFEGVVVKSTYASPGLPLMFKVKSQVWLDRLKGLCKGDEAMFERLR